MLLCGSRIVDWFGGRLLIRGRRDADQADTERLAVEAAPLYVGARTEELQTLLGEAGGELGGRLMVLDMSGKVQADSFEELTGSRVELPEVSSILAGSKTVDYGVHQLGSQQKLSFLSLFRPLNVNAQWVGYSTAALTSGGETVGLVLFSTSIQDVMQRLTTLQGRMAFYFLIAAVASVAIALILSQIISKPIVTLTRSIQRMGRGDLSVRVPARGSGEMRKLADAYNVMAEKLEMLDKSRNQFVSNASHELKTPMATMKIMIESLIYQPDMDKDLRTEFMTDINNEIDRLSAIVSDLLTLVQMDSQNVKLSRENLSIAQLIKDNAPRLQPIAAQKGQKILLTLSDPCDIYADKSKLNQVIYNLMENAVKYTQNGGIIRVALQRQGRDARFTVSDNGPGIPKENLPHIFDRFYRVDKARSREKGGTGLGLSIVHQLVLLHGGAISVESEEGKGATFIVELPLHQG